MEATERHKKTQDLVIKYQLFKSPEVLDQLLLLHDGYVKKLSRKLYDGFNHQVEFEDLVQQARLGLILGIKRCKVDSNYKLLTYADFWMRSEMFTLFCQSLNVHVPAYILRKLLYGLDGLSRPERTKLILILKSVSIDSEFNSHLTLTLERRFNLPNENTTLKLFDNHHIPLDYEKSINKLSYIEQQILYKIYTGFKLTEVAEVLELNYCEAKQKLKKVRKTLRKDLK